MAKMKKKQQNEKLISGWQLQNQYMSAVAIRPVIPILESIKRVCALWEPWQMGICAIRGLRHTGL